MESESIIGDLLQQLSLDEEHARLTKKTPARKRQDEEDISDWSRVESLAAKLPTSLKKHTKSRSQFQQRLERLSLPRIANPNTHAIQYINSSSATINDLWVNRGDRPLPSYDQIIRNQVRKMELLRARINRQPRITVGRSPRHAAEKYKAVASHLHQPNTERLVTRLESGISVIEKLNKIRSRSIPYDEQEYAEAVGQPPASNHVGQ